MYKVGDTVLYGRTGVCKISNIVTREIKGISHQYFELTPLEKKMTVLIPYNDENIFSKMRYILSKEEIYQLIDAMPDSETIWIADKNIRKNKYNEIIAKGDHKQLVKLIKTLYLNKQEQLAKGKKFHVQDMTVLEEAERILYEEFSVTLDIKPEQVLPFIMKTIKIKEKELTHESNK